MFKEKIIFFQKCHLYTRSAHFRYLNLFSPQIRQVLKKSCLKAPKKLDSIKMAKVHVCNVLVLDNPTQFMSKLEFEITFECIEDLPEDLEWKIIYVGSAESEEFDQILDTVYVGPVPEGRHKFVFTADPPNPHKIPVSDVVGVTVILITCAYRGQVSLFNNYDPRF